MSLTGTQFASQILTLMGVEREQKIVDAIFSGDIPEFLKYGWPEITVRRFAGAREREIRYRVAPDYLSVGVIDDFLYTPEWPGPAQTVASAFHCVLPSSRIVDDITSHAVVKVPLQIPPIARPVSPKMETTQAWVQVSSQIKAQLHNQANYHPGVLVAGFKKDVVVGPGLDGSKVAIYGGLKDNLNEFWQPFSTIHPYNYSDYSHGIRLVHRDVLIDGAPMDLADVFQDPVLSQLVSSQGPFNPIFPAKPIVAQPPSPNFKLAASVPVPDKAQAKWLATAVAGIAGGFGVWWLLSQKMRRR